jgi:hypothetical protein
LNVQFEDDGLGLVGTYHNVNTYPSGIGAPLLWSSGVPACYQSNQLRP